MYYVKHGNDLSSTIYAISGPSLERAVCVKLRMSIDLMCKIILMTRSMVGYSYCMEFFVAYYGANPYERSIFLDRYFGTYWWVGYSMFTCNLIFPQLAFPDSRHEQSNGTQKVAAGIYYFLGWLHRVS